MIAVGHPWRPSLNTSLKSACFNDKAVFLFKSKTFGLGTTFLTCQTTRISKLQDAGLTESCQIWLPQKSI